MNTVSLNRDKVFKEKPPKRVKSNECLILLGFFPIQITDWLADREDVIKAISELPNIVKNFEVPYENFNHMDFLYAMNVGEVLYPTLLEEMAKAANSTTGHNF